MLLASGPDNPVTLAFLPATHVVILAETDIAASYEDAFAAVRARLGARTRSAHAARDNPWLVLQLA